MFIRTVAPGREEVLDIGELVQRAGGKPWIGLRNDLTGMFLWSLEKERARIYSDASGTQPIDVAFQIVSETLVSAATPMAAALRIIPLLVHEHGVPARYIANASAQIASESYGSIIDSLLKSHPSLIPDVPNIFKNLLEGSNPALFTSFFQLQESDAGEVELGFSPLFMKQVAEFNAPGSPSGSLERRGCPAGRIVVNKDTLPDEWRERRLHPFTRDMWDAAVDTAVLLYQRSSSQRSASSAAATPIPTAVAAWR